MVRIYCDNDDLVKIEGSTYKDYEIGCYNSNVRIWFTDGTVVLIDHDPSDGWGVWRIHIEHKGSAAIYFTSEGYSAGLHIDAEIKTHEVIDRR